MAVDWKRIKAEYIAGGTTYRKLGEKYGVSRTAIYRRAKDEKWTVSRDRLVTEVDKKTVEKIVDKGSDQAADAYLLACQVRMDMLRYIAEEVKALKTGSGTELAVTESGDILTQSGENTGKRYTKTKRSKLRDLSASFAELTRDMDFGDKSGDDDPLLRYLEEMRNA